MAGRRAHGIILSPHFQRGNVTPKAKRLLNYNSNDMKLSWDGSVEELGKFLAEILAPRNNDGHETQLYCSTNAKFTSFKSGYVTIKFYPTTKTLQIQGKEGDELKTRLLEMLLPRTPSPNIIKRNNINGEDSSTFSNSSIDLTNELKDLEKFIDDSEVKVQEVHEAKLESDRVYNEELFRIWKTLKLIYSKLHCFESNSQANCTSKDNYFMAENCSNCTQYEALTRENDSVKQRLNEVERELKRAKDANYSLIATIQKISSNSHSRLSVVQLDVPGERNYASQSETATDKSEPFVHKSSINSINSQLEDYRERHRKKNIESSCSNQSVTACTNNKLLAEEHASNYTILESSNSQLEEYRKHHNEKYQQQKLLLNSSQNAKITSQPDSSNPSLEDNLNMQYQLRSQDDKILPSTTISLDPVEQGVKSKTKRSKTKKKKKKKAPSVELEISPQDKPVSNQIDPSALPNCNSGNKDLIFIAGDSMIQFVQGRNLSSTNHHVAVKSFSGARIEDMNDFLKPLLRKKPKELILHIGTNNISDGGDPRYVAEGIVNLGFQIEQNSPSTNVAISSILLRSDKPQLNDIINESNRILRKLCRSKGWPFIEHPNIDLTSLNQRGLHLSRRGSNQLTNDFRDHIY